MPPLNPQAPGERPDSQKTTLRACPEVNAHSHASGLPMGNAEDFTGLSARPRSTRLDLFGPLPLDLDPLPLLLLPALLGFLRVPLSLLLFQPLLVFLAEDFVKFSLTELLEFLLHACRGRQRIHTLRYETRGETRQTGKQADRAYHTAHTLAREFVTCTRPHAHVRARRMRACSAHVPQLSVRRSLRASQQLVFAELSSCFPVTCRGMRALHWTRAAGTGRERDTHRQIDTQTKTPQSHARPHACVISAAMSAFERAQVSSHLHAVLQLVSPVWPRTEE